jgi:hypothetical protein
LKWRKKKRTNNYNNKHQQITKQAEMSGRLPNWGLPQGRETNIHPFVGPAKVVKKVRLHNQNRQLTTVCVDVFHGNFSSAS